MQAKRKLPDRDWAALAGQILEDPGNKKEAETATEIAAAINQERRERILQDLSYASVNGKPIFRNLDSKETQEKRLLARKTFDYFMRRTIDSSSLDTTQKAKLLGLLDNNSYEDLPKSIDEKLKNTGYIKAKVDSFILEVSALIIGVGHLLDRLKTGLLKPFGQKFPSKSETIPTPAAKAKEKIADSTDIQPPPPMPSEKSHYRRAATVATPPPSKPVTTKASVTPQAKPKPVQKKEQGRLLPATPPAKTQEKTVTKGSVREKSAFFERLGQQRPTSTARTPNRPK